nr:expressed protein [Hymenolepis microstoma]
MHTSDEVFFVYSNFFSMGCVEVQYNLMNSVNNGVEVEDEVNFVKYVFLISVSVSVSVSVRVPDSVPVGVGDGVPVHSLR